ncbi:MAG: glycoside hydrolase family 31 protein [Lachnospiraceae bacterium]|nr:glycoside hydrolase family 31 protein [Lachnospiraceae bacterium]
MLDCIPYEDMRLESAERKNDALVIKLKKGIQKLVPVDEGTLRVLYSHRELSENDADKPCIVKLPAFSDWDYEEGKDAVLLKMPKLTVRIDKETNSFTYYGKDGGILLRERDQRSKELTEIPLYALSGRAAEKTTVETADGVKELVRNAEKIRTGSAYHTRLNLIFDEEEALFGMGQHEEGYHSLRGNCIYLNQANRTIAIPMFVSVKGYGIFVNTLSPAIFQDTPETTSIYTEADPEMDFFFMNGEGMDGVIRKFRMITGKAAMLPKWAFGYIQSQERYETQKEILEVAGKYREKGIGLDCIVLDWMSWEDGHWGQKSFDAARFPDPSAMIDELHKEHIHFMISIWPNMNGCTDNFREFKEKGLLLPESDLYDPFDPEGRKLYWKQTDEGIFRHGNDAFWCDNSEPLCPEWTKDVRPENPKNYEEYCSFVSNHIPLTKLNAYGLFHAMGIWEGWRASGDPRRVVNLTRSGTAGQQRYGTILWSGDISASWETLEKQIAAGLHFCASGMPYWTLDIGAFFVKNGVQWYWNGKYDLGEKDPAYCELFVRWYEWGAFLPVFRGHGTDVRRELWNFDRKEASFYQAILDANRRRYELMPYIYSLAAAVHFEDALIMRPLSFAFSDDGNTWDIFDQYLFGDALMICPVTKPMYFGTEKEEEAREEETEKSGAGKCSRRVYLPGKTDWYDLYTDRRYKGGQWIEADAPLERIPVFVKAGSLIPMAKAALSVEEQEKDITIHIYPGADARFMLYEDSGDGYGYEKGEYSFTEYSWNDEKKTLSVNGIPIGKEAVTPVKEGKSGYLFHG